MRIVLANPTLISEVVSFFNENSDRINSAVYSEEFLCPLRIKAAIRRKQMIVETVEGQVVAAFRFYRKKHKTKYLYTNLQLVKFIAVKGY